MVGQNGGRSDLNSLSLDHWLAEYERLKKVNEQIMGRRQDETKRR